MSWIDPEKIMTGLMKSMGVSPQDFVGFIQTAQREFAEMRADRLAFKPASIRVVNEMNARMDRIEAKLNILLSRVGCTFMGETPDKPELTNLPATLQEFPNGRHHT